MTDQRYPFEALGEDEDDGTMPDNVDKLAATVVGRRIVSAEQRETTHKWSTTTDLVLTLDDGRKVMLANTSDCCAFTELDAFWLDPSAIDHVILGVGTTDEYSTWHIYADFGDVMRMQVGWSPGNPFYYGYGFDITVTEVDQ